MIDNSRWEKTLSANKLYDDYLIVFLGDSQIDRWLMAPSFGTLPIINRGLSGDWALKAVDRFDKDVINKKPKLVVLLIGGNDLWNGQPIDAIISHIEMMLKKSTNQNIKVILCSLLPVGKNYIKNLPPEDLLLMNRRLETLSKQYKADYVDFYSQLIDENGLFRSDLTSDGLHPSESGYLRMSKIIFPYLMKNIVKNFH
jgi:lysophospholipase L1-like esterase